MTIPSTPNRRDSVKFIVEVIGFIIAVCAIVFTGFQTKAAADSAAAASMSVTTALQQLYETKYQAVYQQQLDIWKQAIDKPEFAIEVAGGKDSAEAVSNARQNLALDFYAYIYSELAPTDANDHQIGLALDPLAQPPNGVAEADWIGWQSWSSNIATGFKANTQLPVCRTLATNWLAYDINFRNSVRNAAVCTGLPSN